MDKKLTPSPWTTQKLTTLKWTTPTKLLGLGFGFGYSIEVGVSVLSMDYTDGLSKP